MRELAWETESLIYRSRVSLSDSREAEELALGVGDLACSALRPRTRVAVRYSPSRCRSSRPPRASSSPAPCAYRRVVSNNGAEARGGEKGSRERERKSGGERGFMLFIRFN
ncbi:hypothetical protein Dimus_013775 [Dionaea muscipula]